MQILKQIHRKAIRLIEYLVVYFIGIFLIVGFFSFVYNKLGILYPIRSSINIFFGIDNKYPVPRYAHIFQIIVQNIFFVAWVGTFLSSLLKPLNPFFFSKYIAYFNSRLIFRYWIMLPRGQFLYNINIRIILSYGLLYNGGVNKINGDWQISQNINLARGVHYVSLPKKDSKKVLHKIDVLRRKGKSPTLAILIQGNNENGLTFFHGKSYLLETSLKEGYNFVSIRQPECVRSARNLGYDKEIPEDPSLIRYQNFDKIYHISGKSEPTNRDVLSYTQLAEGEYGPGICQSISDCINRIISFFLDKNGCKNFVKSSKR